MTRRVLAGLALVLVAACGRGTSGDELGAGAAGVLGKDVDAIAAAARADDEGRVQALLLQLRQHVERYQASGEVGTARAQRVLAAAARVATDVGAPEPEVVVSVAPAPPSAPARKGGGEDRRGKGDEEDADEEDGKGKGDD